MRRLSSLLLLLLPFVAATAVVAQPAGYAVLSGTVVDAETGAPLEGAHVIVASSMKGTVTDAQGRYRLVDVPVGALRLYVSMLGFDSGVRDELLREPRAYSFDFRLNPSVIQVGEVTVEGREDKRWQERFDKFVGLFIGESPNAAETEIINPFVLDFDEKVGRFTARASEPLVIENQALGYRITYFLKEFVATPNRTSYDGEPLFEEMEPDSPAQAAIWAANRRAAYLGSFRHFILSLWAGDVEGAGFKTYSRPAEQRGPGAFGAGATPGRNRFPLKPEKMYRDGDSAEEKRLDFHGFVEIIYTGEMEDASFLTWSREAGRKPRYQTSWILLERGPAVVDYKGDVLDPYGVTYYGYLAFERVADELPREYRPG